MAYLIAKPRGKLAKPVSQVLQQLSEASPSRVGETSLGRLIPLAAQSRQMLQSILPILPGQLASQLRPGKFDDQEWTLTAANGATASKLQQLKPELLAQLKKQGWKVSSIRIRVQGPS